MFALVGKHTTGEVFISQTDPDAGALRRVADDYRRRWADVHWSVHPFLKVIDQKRSSGANPYPIRDGFDLERPSVQ